MRHSTLVALSLALSFIVQAAGSSSGTQQAQEQLSPEAEAEIARATAGDLATSINEGVDGSDARISAGMYRAIKAIESYREQVQKAELTSNERQLGNFNISFRSKRNSLFLRDEERETCYEIVLSARFLPGEKVLMDIPGVLGRSAAYAVRKSDYRVLRAEIDKRKPGG